ncbi:Y-family DNA polymerase [Hyphococcus sp.]|uniref:Y-family DNA polymerase n=1 Tax=Hyphococcus sp. TaxID=2038636 RepID=UPI003CCBF57F
MSLGKRILCIWMPRLPVNRFGRSGLPVEDCLFAVTAEEKNAVRLICLNKHARRLGLAPGMTLATARAAAPELITVAEEPLRDEAFLKALQRWANKFTPWSACEGKDNLLLNITGCAHLFGGERAMADYIVQELADKQVEARIGVADTKGAAMAAARYGAKGETIIPAGETRQRLAKFPIEALFVSDQTIFELKRLGLKRIGDLYPLKSADLMKRFGLGLLRAYEKLLGSAADPVTPAKAQPIFAARMSFPDPIGLTDDVSEALNRLTDQVCKRLSEHAFGLRAARLSIYRADKQQMHIDIGLARPTQEAKQIIRQFVLKFDKIDAGCGIDVMRLSATKAEPFEPKQKRFADAEKQNQLDELVATLGNQLGFDRVLRWRPLESHLPRRSFRFVEAVQCKDDGQWKASLSRPLMAYEGEHATILEPGRPPKRFEWRGRTFTAARFKGPERIGPEWWKGPQSDELKDYWQIDCEEGPRLWLTTKPGEKPHRWEVAGLFP